MGGLQRASGRRKADRAGRAGAIGRPSAVMREATPPEPPPWSPPAPTTRGDPHTCPIEDEPANWSGTSVPAIRRRLAYVHGNMQRNAAATATGHATQHLHYLILHVVITRQPVIARMLAGLHLPITTVRWPESGDLPVTMVESSISTIRPDDEMLIQTVELSGTDAFEEVVNVDDIKNLKDPLQVHLLEIAKSQEG